MQAVNGLLAVAELDPSRLFLATRRGFETSRDGGETWTRVSPGPIQNLQDSYEILIVDVVFAPSDPETVYIFLEIPGGGGFPDELRIVRSRDGGASWEISRGPEFRRVGARGLVIDPVDADTVYLVLSTGVFQSLDGGGTWQPLNDGLPSYEVNGGREITYPLRAFAIDPADPATLYVGLEDRLAEGILGGVFRSTDGGASWAPAQQGLPLPLPVHSFAIDPDAHGTVYAATAKGVLQSIDGGDHWRPTPTRLPTPASSVAVDPEVPSTVFAGTDDLRLFTSDDGGQRWSRTGEGIEPAYDSIAIGGPLDFLAIAPSDPSVLFAEGFLLGGLGRSTDGGATWRVLASSPPGSKVVDLVIHPRDPARAVAVFDHGTRPGVFLTTDLADHWQLLLKGVFSALAQAPSDPAVLYAAVYAREPSSPDAPGVCRSADGGGSWQCSVSGLADRGKVTALAVDPRDSSVLLAALGNQVYRSLDGGATWSPIAVLPEGVGFWELLFDPRRSEVVWGRAIGRGVFRSTDGGSSWTEVNRGLTHPYVQDLALDPSGRVLLAATGSGVFRFSSTAGPAPPDEFPWTTDPALSGFRVKVRIAQGGGETIPGTREPACIPATLCVSGAVPGRSELFVRIVGPKPNGWLWPTLVKFSTARIEVWIQQLSTGELRYYELRGASPGFDELPGLFDRFGFLPD